MKNINVINILRKLFLKYLLFRSGLRTIFLNLFGLKIGRNVIIGKKINFPIFNLKNIQIENNINIGDNGWFFLPINNKKSKIIIGNGTNIGNNFVISCNNSIEIGENCLFSYNTSIIDHNHVFNKESHPTKSGLTNGRSIKIGSDCFIGCNAVILSGVTLGDHCIVGANSVVTKSFDKNLIIAGAPARVIKELC